MTINEALSLMREVKSRIRSLESLRDRVSVTERFYTSTEKSKTPEYKVQQVDAMLVRLNELHFEMDHAIKSSNARTELDSDFDTTVIFESLK